MTKRAPQIGDVFAVRGTAVLGRVVSTSAVVGPTHGCILVYLYADAKRRARDRLLVPPLLTTRAPWSHGLFEAVRSEPLLPGDYFERHAFRDAAGQLYDEEGRPLADAEGPVGEWVLQPVEAIERALATALSSSRSRSRTSRSSSPPRGTRKRTPPSRSR
jgi:hypothetical protein